MRHLVSALILCSSPLLLAAAAPVPSGVSVRLATATLVAADCVPIVVVYPLESTDAPAGSGASIAQLLAKTMTSDPGLALTAIGTGVKRPNYLSYAKSKGADYYVGGNLAQVGTGASIVLQIVDVASGVIVYSTAHQVQTVDDLTPLAFTVRAAILHVFGTAKHCSTAK